MKDPNGNDLTTEESLVWCAAFGAAASTMTMRRAETAADGAVSDYRTLLGERTARKPGRRASQPSKQVKT